VLSSVILICIILIFIIGLLVNELDVEGRHPLFRETGDIKPISRLEYRRVFQEGTGKLVYADIHCLDEETCDQAFEIIQKYGERASICNEKRPTPMKRYSFIFSALYNGEDIVRRLDKLK